MAPVTIPTDTTPLDSGFVLAALANPRLDFPDERTTRRSVCESPIALRQHCLKAVGHDELGLASTRCAGVNLPGPLAHASSWQGSYAPCSPGATPRPATWRIRNIADDTDLSDNLVETAAEPAEAGVAVGSCSKNFWQQNQPILAWPFRSGRLPGARGRRRADRALPQGPDRSDGTRRGGAPCRRRRRAGDDDPARLRLSVERRSGTVK